MSLTKFIRPILSTRLHKLDAYTSKAEILQRNVLRQLLSKSCSTEWGSAHGYAKDLSYENFVRQTPLNTYEELKGFIDRMRHGEKDVLWPGRVKWYAKSSGTTNDKSKFIPV
ncbi:MAG: GH3 auxin-responsive promoter family protein, partial [Bacteroidaceae bacterium]|nr:GH3 auxin-responsive promoter family protein [Bacteroidaceae bacterium]